ncbi:amino acid ABC transporter permease [Clostridium sp. BJN0001]|uniref:amino acid ABC transporter permease n=1 Tax=Clostridium sp. BJN0001 TaxID=2930219 RepID=UPI001FD3A7D0|nr:amino acid ABC transporter permease [Clostridium sp. BJN0001]
MQNLGIKVIFEPGNIGRLFEGLYVTCAIAFSSIILGLILGAIIGIIRMSKNKAVLFINRVYLEAFRIIPTLVWLFIFYFGVSKIINIDVSGETMSIVVFTLWGAAEMGDLVRGALMSISKHQIESGKALGLNTFNLYRYIMIPQAIRKLLPGVINLSTRMIKTTSLVVLIGVIDVVKVGQQIIETSRFDYPDASFYIYAFIFFLYFIVCYPLSKISKRIETHFKEQ